MLRRWGFRLVPSERSLEAVGESVRLHIISRSKAFDLFPRTYKGKNRCVLRQKYALINSRERTLKSDINLEQSSQAVVDDGGVVHRQHAGGAAVGLPVLDGALITRGQKQQDGDQRRAEDHRRVVPEPGGIE